LTWRANWVRCQRVRLVKISSRSFSAFFSSFLISAAKSTFSVEYPFSSRIFYSSSTRGFSKSR